MMYQQNIPKSKKCSLFSCQKLNKYFLLPFFIPIICFTTKFFSETMKTDGDKKTIDQVTTDNTHTFVFLYQIIQSLCLILGGLLYFISRFISKRKNKIEIDNDSKDNVANNNSENNNKILDKYLKRTNEVIKKKDWKKILIVILMPFLLIIYNLSIAYGVGFPQLEKRVYFLFFITLISVFVFKKQLFKHQKLALIITAIGAIPIYISFGLYLNTKIYSIAFDIFLLIGSFCYSIYLIFIKYLTVTKQMSVFLLLLYQGILCTIFTLIIFSIISLIANKDFTYISNIFHCNETNYICVSNYYIKIIAYFILNTALQTLIFLVVYIFSPELFAISDIFSPLFSFIAQWIKDKEKNGLKIFLYVFGYLIMALGAFIYNEIIVCNFYGLNKNTWKAIDQKAYEEILDNDSRDTSVFIGDYKIDDFSTKKDDNYIEMNYRV